MAEHITTATGEAPLKTFLTVIGVLATPIALMTLIGLVVPLPPWVGTPTVGLAAVLLVIVMVRRSLARSALLAHLKVSGRRGDATILAVSQESNPTRGRYMLRLSLRVQDHAGTFTANHIELVDAVNLARVQKGMSVPVVWDPDDRRKLFLRLDG